MQSNLLSLLGELSLPETCVVCGTIPLPSFAADTWRVAGSPICQACVSLLQRCNVTGCTRCGAPVAPHISYCLTCRKTLESHDDDNGSEFPVTDLGRIYSVLVYKGSTARLVSGWKIGSRRALTPILVQLLYEYLLEILLENIDEDGRYQLQSYVIVPVPPRPAARVKRGWDPTGTLARGLASRAGLPYCRVMRRRNGRQQKSLNKHDRFHNIQGAFSIHHRFRQRIPAHILLIDDVATTGSTLAACATLLRNSGAETIVPLVLARDL